LSILKRGNSKFWYIQFQLDGKTFIRSSKTTDKKTAELAESEWRAQLVRDQLFGARPRIAIANSFDRYCQSKAELRNYGNLVNHSRHLMPSFAGKSFLDELTSSDLEEVRLSHQRIGYASQTIKHRLNFLRGVVKYAERTGYRVPTLSFPAIALPKGRLRYLTFDEESRLLAAVDPKRKIRGMAPYEERPAQTKQEMQDIADFVVFLLDTGARYTEAATLPWASVDMERGTLTLWRAKVNNESILFITERLMSVLRRRHAERTGAYVFSNRKGQARGYNAGTIRKAFDRADLKDCSAHTLRHTHATRLIQHGLSIYEVKEMLGHADIKTTMRYAHIEQRATSSKAKAVIDRFNEGRDALLALEVGR
jgi:integrase